MAFTTSIINRSPLQAISLLSDHWTADISLIFKVSVQVRRTTYWQFCPLSHVMPIPYFEPPDASSSLIIHKTLCVWAALWGAQTHSKSCRAAHSHSDPGELLQCQDVSMRRHGDSVKMAGQRHTFSQIGVNSNHVVVRPRCFWLQGKHGLSWDWDWLCIMVMYGPNIFQIDHEVLLFCS